MHSSEDTCPYWRRISARVRESKPRACTRLTHRANTPPRGSVRLPVPGLQRPVLAGRDTHREGHQPQGIRGGAAEQGAWGCVRTAPCVSLQAPLLCRAARRAPAVTLPAPVSSQGASREHLQQPVKQKTSMRGCWAQFLCSWGTWLPYGQTQAKAL